MILERFKFTKEHEWVAIEGNIAIVGITDFAQGSLGDITFVKLPEPGKKLKQFQECSTIESIKAVSDIYSPLSGTVLEVNKTLEQKPELINKSCYEEGWLFKLIEFDVSELDNLMTFEQYKNYLETLK